MRRSIGKDFIQAGGEGGFGRTICPEGKYATGLQVLRQLSQTFMGIEMGVGTLPKQLSDLEEGSANSVKVDNRSKGRLPY